MINRFKLVDIWRNLHSNRQQYTWRRKNNIEKSRIDIWLIDENIVPLVYSTDIRPALIQYTDHLAISLKIKLPTKRGPGFWKLNNSYIEDKLYQENIVKIIKNCLALDNQSFQTKWEVCKYQIKEFSIKYSKRKSRERNNELQKLEEQLKHYYSLPNIDEYTKNKISKLENDIRHIYNYKVQGAQIRSRLQLLEEGEKCSTFFINL